MLSIINFNSSFGIDTHFFFFFKINNFILRWYCTIAEANKNQPLITINMVKIYPVEADTNVITMRQTFTAMSIPH